MWKKAARLLYQRRVRLLTCGEDHCEAEVVGDSGRYRVTLERGGWSCNCRLRDVRPSWACSHVASVSLAYEAAKHLIPEGEGKHDSEDA